MKKNKNKVIVTIKGKKSRKVNPDEVLPLIFSGLRRRQKISNPTRKFLTDELLDDIMFSKVTANYKSLHKKFGEGFKLSYDAYKKGKGGIRRKIMAKEIREKYLQDKDIKKGLLPQNPNPDNPYMKLQDGVWVDMSPKAVADKIRAMKNKSMEAMQPIADMTARIQKSNEELFKQKFQKVNEAIKLQQEQFHKANLILEKRIIARTKHIQILSGKGEPYNYIDPQGNHRSVDALDKDGNPIEFKFNPFAFADKNKSILGRGLLDIKALKIPRIKPTGSSRPAVMGTGLTSYMERHKIKNPVDFAKVYKTKEGKDYKIYGFDNLRFLCEQMNVTVEEAILYICEGMTSTNSRWRDHRIDKEYWRGSQSVINLVEYYDEQLIKNKKKKLIVYTIKALWNDTYTKTLFIEYGVERGSYSEFSRWFKKMKHHVYAYKLAKNMSKTN